MKSSMAEVMLCGWLFHKVWMMVRKEGSFNQEDRVVVRRGYREVSDIGFVEKEFPLWIRETSV